MRQWNRPTCSNPARDRQPPCGPVRFGDGAGIPARKRRGQAPALRLHYQEPPCRAGVLPPPCSRKPPHSLLPTHPPAPALRHTPRLPTCHPEPPAKDLTQKGSDTGGRYMRSFGCSPPLIQPGFAGLPSTSGGRYSAADVCAVYDLIKSRRPASLVECRALCHQEGSSRSESRHVIPVAAVTMAGRMQSFS